MASMGSSGAVVIIHAVVDLIDMTQDELHKNIDTIIYGLARFMHEEHENSARQFGLVTPESARVDFDDLPEANKKTMLMVALRVWKFMIEPTKGGV
jgi:hypothetical protein